MAINIGGLLGLILFYLLILGIGFWAARKKGHGEIETMLAGRRIGWFLGSLTLTATWVGGGMINGTAEMVFREGIVWTQTAWGYALALSICGILFAKKMREKEYITLLDPFQQKYGNRVGALMFLPALCGALFYSGAIMNALGATVGVILGLHKTSAVISSAAVVVLYTMFGGLFSVIYTDVIQLAAMALGLIICTPFAATHPAVEPISSTSSEWLGKWSKTLTPIWIDDTLLLMMGGIPWQDLFQRVLATKSPRISQFVCFSGTMGVLLLCISPAFIGAIGRSTDWTQTSLYNPPLNATNYTMPQPDPALILPLVIQYLTPTWAGVIGLGSVAAAVMSSADSSVLATSTLFTQNIYKPLFRQKASRKEVMWVMRISVIVFGFLSCTLALTVKSIYALFYLCGDLVYVVLFPQLLCVIYLHRSNAYGALAGFIIGLFLRIAGGEKYLHFSPLIKYPYYSDTYGQLFPFKTFSMVCSLVTIVTVSFITWYLFKTKLLGPSWDLFSVFNKSYDVNTNRATEMNVGTAACEKKPLTKDEI